MRCWSPWWSGRGSCACSMRSGPRPCAVSRGRSAFPAGGWSRGRRRRRAPCGRPGRSWPSPTAASGCWDGWTLSPTGPTSSCSPCWGWWTAPPWTGWPPAPPRWRRSFSSPCPTCSERRPSSTPMSWSPPPRRTSPMRSSASQKITGGRTDGRMSPSTPGRGGLSGASPGGSPGI